MHEEKLRDKLWNRAVRRGVEPGARDLFKARCLYNTRLSPDTRKLSKIKALTCSEKHVSAMVGEDGFEPSKS